MPQTQEEWESLRRAIMNSDLPAETRAILLNQVNQDRQVQASKLTSPTPSSSPDSGNSSDPEKPTSSSEQAKWQTQPGASLHQEDYPAFVRETTHNMQFILQTEMTDMATAATLMEEDGKEPPLGLIQAHWMMTGMAMLCQQLHDSATPPEPELLLPDKRLLGPDGRPVPNA